LRSRRAPAYLKDEISGKGDTAIIAACGAGCRINPVLGSKRHHRTAYRQALADQLAKIGNVRVDDQSQYLACLEMASGEMNAGPFAALPAERVKWSAEQTG
jgi:hypothetical protein